MKRIIFWPPGCPPQRDQRNLRIGYEFFFWAGQIHPTGFQRSFVRPRKSETDWYKQEEKQANGAGGPVFKSQPSQYIGLPKPILLEKN